MIGDYDREIISNSAGTSESGELFSPPGKNQSFSYQTHASGSSPPSDIADLPDRQALLMRGAAWSLIETTSWFESGLGEHRQPPPLLVHATACGSVLDAASGVWNSTGLVSESILTCHGR